MARRLAAILAADVAGYSRLTQADEEGTLTRLRALRHELFLPKIAEHRGRVVKTSGDGMLIEFASVVDAVRAAIELQRALATQNVDVPPDRRIELRIGINLGDVVVEEDGDLMGDGVNVAARLEALAEPGGICISATVLNHVRDKLSFAVEDAGDQVLKNIARPIHVYRIVVDARQRRAMSRPQDGALALPDKPSIAVLPFQNMSGDPEQDYFADGIVEEIITALSRIRWLFVIARNSSFTYKGRAIDVKQVGRELGVRYVLEGSVRKAEHRMRITGQLIDVLSGAHLWADRFDGSLEDVFELQDSVASSVAGVIEPTLEAAEIHYSAQRPTTDLTAYDLYLRARAANQSWDKESVLRALDLLREALERDPHYASALALAAACHTLLHINRWSEDQEKIRQQSVDYARRALRVAGGDPYVLGESAFTLGYFERDINPALVLIDRSLELNPNFAIGWLRSGWLRLWSGQADLAIEHFEKSLRLNPRRKAPASMAIGVAHFFARRLDKAAAVLMLSLQENPHWPPTYRFLASCFAHMGRHRDAQDMVKKLREMTPELVPSAEHWRVAEDREFYLAGLRSAVSEATTST
ncbi:MAG TPA: adenylate/guanylate cyclase domain-containing protein [Stellaceae bacterium]|nr:adenylate/guanylate cyclase domain-containing protein [Stellaceae bacterium]